MLGSPGGSGGEAVVFFLAVPKCLGSGTANPLTHMSLLPRGSLGKGKSRGPGAGGTRRRSPGLAVAARRQAGRHCVM